MRKLLAYIVLILLAVFFHTGLPAEAAESPVYEEILPNGLKVLILKDPNAPVAVFQIWYHAGSINEEIGKTGLSHLLEHMMFKGTNRYGPRTFSSMIKRAGGIDNAGTSRDYAFYYQKLAPERLKLSIELEADRMKNLILDPWETVSERNVVMEERRLRYEDDPQNLVYEEVIAAAFRNHPYRWPVIGWMEDLKEISREDLIEYYEKFYAPNNALIVVAGNVDTDAVMQQIKEKFSSIPKGRVLSRGKVGEPEQRGERRVVVRKEAELPYIVIAYKAPNIPHEDSYALEILSSVLSGGRSARIYKNMIDEKRIALSAGTGYNNLQKFPFLFYLYGTALPGRTVSELEEALGDEIDKIKNEPPSEREVQKAKNQIEADFIMGQDSAFFQAEILAVFEMIGDWKLRDKYLEGVRRVTPKDVQAVAQRYLVKEKSTVGVLIPIINKESQ